MSINKSLESMAAEEPHLTKWLDYYERSFTPWDTRLPASQLVHYLTSCIAEDGLWACNGGSSSSCDGDTAHLQTSSCSEGLPLFRFCQAAGLNGMTIASPRFHACPKCAHLKPAAATAASTMPPMKLTCHDAECEKPEEPQAAAGSAGGRAAAGWWALELGSGTGASCVMMAQCGAQAVGVDCAPAAVAAAEELAAALGVGVDADGSSIGSSGRSDGSSRGSGRADGSSGSSSGRGCARFITHDIFTLPRPFTPHTACALHSAQTAAGQTTQSQLQLSPQAQDSAHGRQPQHSAEGFACSTKPAPAAGHLGAPPPDRLFDFIYDCQSFHVLRCVDEGGYLQLLSSSLRRGGLLLLLAGARVGDDDEPEAVQGQAGAAAQQGKSCSKAADHFREIWVQPSTAWCSFSGAGGAGAAGSAGFPSCAAAAAACTDAATTAQERAAGAHEHEPEHSAAGASQGTGSQAEAGRSCAHRAQCAAGAQTNASGAAGSADCAKRLGPPQLSRQELMTAFRAPDWEWVTLVLSRFDSTPYYEAHYDQPPLAWLGLLRRL